MFNYGLTTYQGISTAGKPQGTFRIKHFKLAVPCSDTGYKSTVVNWAFPPFAQRVT